MRQNQIWDFVTKVYDQAEVALWALLLSGLICFFAFVFPKLPELRARVERTRAQEIAREDAHYCETLGVRKDDKNYAQCLLSLGEFRLKVEQRIADEQYF